MTTAYHFTGDKLRDGRPLPGDGVWLVHDGPVEMCESGLHASRDPFDALKYAPGATLCLVECEDVVEEQEDKLVCRRRKIVKRIDATDLLRRFARQCALDVIHLWDAPAVVREYLETGDESKRVAAEAAARAARAAAWDAAGAAWVAALDAVSVAAGAARAAAWAAAGAARAAAWVAARAAAEDAAEDAARAAWVAAEAAAWDAWDAAWDAAEDARVAAEAAARAAAWDAARERFNAMVAEAMA